MKLELNESYELEVIDICNSANGYDYFLALGPDDKTYSVFNIMKFQYLEMPKSITCVVTGFDIHGKARLRQDERPLLQEHYALEHYYSFEIADRKEDKGKHYYVIEDDFSSQRWYSEEEYEIGDDIILEAKSLTKGGYIYYTTHKDEDEPDLSGCVVETRPAVRPSGNLPICDAGEESQTLEYKTSIVFTPGSDEPDIDKQVFAIVRVLASFMNAQGGTLYIGVHDKTREVCGIAKDLPHLSDGESKNSYSADIDHYQLKIRDELVSYCGGVAGSLVEFGFPEQDGVVYCRIDVQAAKRPIWCKGNMLFQRQGNQVQMLRGEALTQFVGERIGSYILAMAREEGEENMSQSQMNIMIHNAVKSAINDRRASVAAPQVEPDAGSVKYWVVWFKDGTWSKQKTKSEDDNVFCQLPMTDDTANVNVAFCYKTGTVNRVKMTDFVKGTKMREVNRGGFFPDEAPLAIYLCHPSDLIGVFSADTGGTEYVKVHHLTDFGYTGGGKNKGSYIIPRGKGQVLEFKRLSAVQGESVKALVANKKETTTSFGMDIRNITVQKEVECLQEI